MATSRSDPRTGPAPAPSGAPPGAVPGRRLLVVEHDPDAPAGVLGDWAAARGLAVRTVRLHAGEALPDGGTCDAAVLLGSEHTAYDDTVPWLARELAFLDDLIAGSVPVLGICFGGQLLARALGARLYRLPEPEIGWVDIGSHDPHLAAGPWLSWHRDAFDLPPGGRVLAANPVSLQAFHLGPHVGVQFHPEATAPIITDWLAGTDPPPGQRLRSALTGDGARGRWKQAAAHAWALFSAWFTRSLGERAGAKAGPG